MPQAVVSVAQSQAASKVKAAKAATSAPLSAAAIVSLSKSAVAAATSAAAATTAKATASAALAKPVSAAVTAAKTAAAASAKTPPKAAPASEPQKPPAQTPAAFVAGKGDVVVDVLSSDSGYNNRIYYSTDNWKTKQYIGIDNQTQSVNLGSFAAGTRIEFGIDNGQGDFFKTGAASVNADNFQHAQVTSSASGTRIGFEDLRGGGDRDFNDAIINVRTVAAAATAPAKNAPKAKGPTTPHDNRSGLGDGTNPGNGAGTANSPNVGTHNPNQSGSVKKT